MDSKYNLVKVTREGENNVTFEALENLDFNSFENGLDYAVSDLNKMRLHNSQLRGYKVYRTNIGIGLSKGDNQPFKVTISVWPNELFNSMLNGLKNESFSQEEVNAILGLLLCEFKGLSNKREKMGVEAI